MCIYKFGQSCDTSVHFNENHKVFMAKDTFHELAVQLFQTNNIEVFCSNSFLIVKVLFIKNFLVCLGKLHSSF